MAECKWLRDEICVNADCPMRADYCPVPDTEGVCRYEERPDVVAVVRCKDCKHRKLQHHRGGEIWYQCANEAAGMASGVELKDNDFCSYGERREENATD